MMRVPVSSHQVQLTR